MADVDFDEYQGGYGDGPSAPQAARAQRWVSIAGALTSIALVVGIGVWGYRIAVRDAMGVPVVRALEGPMRVAPENPGGEVTEHQGLSVNDVAATGVASPVPDSMILAPRAVDLTLDDTPGLADAPPISEVVASAVAQKPIPEVVAPVNPLTSVAPMPQDAPAPVTLDANTNISDLADALAAGVAPMEAEPVPVEEISTEVASGGIGRSLRPMARPRIATAAVAVGGVTATAADAAVAAALGLGAAEIDVANLPSGTRLVQLGAFDNEEQARGEWDRLASRFGDLMVGKSRVVQSAQSGGRTFYRLRAHGFDGEDDARRFCSALVAENAECIPVAIR